MYMGNVEMIVTSELINAQCNATTLAHTHATDEQPFSDKHNDQPIAAVMVTHTHTHQKHKHRFAQTPLAKPL